MITCPRCGLNARPDTPVCQRCGTPLSGAVPPGAGMPAWLQQFQAQQQPPQRSPQPGAAPAGWGAPQPPGYGFPQAGAPGGVPGGPGGNLFDESALPEWLRQGANGMPAGPQSATMQSPYGAAPGGYVPAVPAGYRAPGGDMTARSLIDDRALPGWMNQAPGGAPPAGVGGTFGPREGLDARSLVDESSLPQWLQGLQGGAAGGAAPAPQWGPGQMGQEPAPAWLGQPAGMGSGGVGAPGAAPIAAPVPAAGPHAMNAGQLADESALPPWLRAQGPGASASSAAGSNGAPNLVDPNALPAWVRSGSAAAEERFNGSMAGAAAGQAPRRPPNSEWLTDAHVPARQGPPPAGAPGGGELPSWLGNGSQAAGPAANSAANRGFGQPGGVPEDQLPPWLQRGQGQPAGSSAAQRPPAGPPARIQPDFSGSRAGYVDPRLQQQQGGYGQGGYGQGGYGQGGPNDGYEPEDFADWDDDGQGQQRRRGGFFGRFRRK